MPPRCLTKSLFNSLASVPNLEGDIIIIHLLFLEIRSFVSPISHSIRSIFTPDEALLTWLNTVNRALLINSSRYPLDPYDRKAGEELGNIDRTRSEGASFRIVINFLYPSLSLFSNVIPVIEARGSRVVIYPRRNS